jgi:hypothetical protein
MTIKIEVYHDGEAWCARGIDYDIFTCAKSLDKLIKSIEQATCCHFSGRTKKRKLEVIIRKNLDETSISKTSANKR